MSVSRAIGRTLFRRTQRMESSLLRLMGSPGFVEFDWRGLLIGLMVHGQEFDDSQVAFLFGFHRLRELCLDHTGVSIKGFRVLIHHPALEKLELYQPDFGDELVPLLREAAHIKGLRLNGLKLSQGSIDNLKALKHLRYLVLPSEASQWKGISALQGDLPKCAVHIQQA